MKRAMSNDNSQIRMTIGRVTSDKQRSNYNQMKKYIIISSLILTVTFSGFAQNESDVLLSSQTNLTGTARSTGLSGAMGAVGGDMSALSINPAGIAVYRSSEFSMSTGFITNTTDATQGGMTMSDTKTIMPFNHIGLIGTYKPLREKSQGVISSNFGFTYNRINNYNQNIYWQGENVNYSILDKAVMDGAGYLPADFNPETEPFNYSNTLSGLAYNTYLLNEINENSGEYFNVFEGFDADGNIYWLPTNGIRQIQRVDVSGNGGEYGFTAGMNISNILLLGGSMNFQHISYDELSTYREIDAYGLDNPQPFDIDYFDYHQHRNLSATSINFKIGAIIKPINELRIGLALHTPNWYQFHQEYSSAFTSYFKDNKQYNASSSLQVYDYDLNTPLKFIGSIAYLFGNRGLISADYEYQDYSSAKFNTASNSNIDDASLMAELNNGISTAFQTTHSFRFGAECRLTDNVIARAGYSFQGSPYKEEYLSKKMEFTTYSCGLGFRSDFFFIDTAFMLVDQNKDHYVYNWSNPNYPAVQPTLLESKTYYGTITVGYKF